MVAGTLFWPGSLLRQLANRVPVTIFPGGPLEKNGSRDIILA